MSLLARQSSFNTRVESFKRYKEDYDEDESSSSSAPTPVRSQSPVLGRAPSRGSTVEPKLMRKDSFTSSASTVSVNNSAPPSRSSKFEGMAGFLQLAPPKDSSITFHPFTLRFIVPVKRQEEKNVIASKDIKEQQQQQLRAERLAKERDLEIDFRDHSYAKNLKGIRISLLVSVAAVLVGIFVQLIGHWASPLAAGSSFLHAIYFVIIGMNIPQVALFGFTFLKYCSAFVEQICATILTFVQAAMMITWSQWEYGEVHNITCVASLLILLHVSVHYYKINFLQTLAVSCCIFLGYLGVWLRYEISDEFKGEFLFALFSLLLGYAVEVFTSYRMELLARKKFLLGRKHNKHVQNLTEQTLKLTNELSRRALGLFGVVDPSKVKPPPTPPLGGGNVTEDEEAPVDSKDMAQFMSPIEKVMQKIQKMKKSDNLSIEESIDLQFISDTLSSALSSGTVWSPDVVSKGSSGVMDSDIKNWLQYEVTREGQTRTLSTTKQVRQSIDPVMDTAQGMPEEFLRLSESPNTSFSSFHVLSNKSDNALSELLRRVSDWNFDIFQFATVTEGRPLTFLAKFIFRKHNLFQKFTLDPAKFASFVETIEEGYHQMNPYHNSTHAADVLSNCHWLIVKGGLINYITDTDILILLFAAIIHDFDHPGLNNSYQVVTRSDLAIRYNDKSVLESHHAAAAFAVLKNDSYNFTSALSQADAAILRKGVIELVMSTDVSQHFDVLSQFKTKVATGAWNRNNPDDRMLLMKIAIKVADMANTTKSSKLYLEWCDRITEEFFRQGDKERELGLPISPFMDRNKPMVGKSQQGFIDFMVQPLVDAYAQFIGQPKTFELVVNLRHNYSMWNQQRKQLKPL